MNDDRLDTVIALLDGMTDIELSGLAEAIGAQQRRRAAESGDLSAIVEEAFRTGFDQAGVARQPWIDSGVVVCPGSRIGTPPTHRCRFVSVGDTWVWEHPDTLIDQMRSVSAAQTRTVSVLAAVDGTELWQVSSRARNGQHQRHQAHGWRVQAGRLEPIGVRNSSQAAHR